MFQRFEKQKHLNKYPINSDRSIFRASSRIINYPKNFGNFNGWYKIYDLYAGTFPPQFEAKEDWIKTYEEFSDRGYSKI